MTKKLIFIMAVIKTLQELASILRKIRDLVKVYNDLGYGSTDPITDADMGTYRGQGELDTIGITAADFLGAAAVLIEFQAFMSNGASTAKDREAAINKIRKDL